MLCVSPAVCIDKLTCVCVCLEWECCSWPVDHTYNCTVTRRPVADVVERLIQTMMNSDILIKTLWLVLLKVAYAPLNRFNDSFLSLMVFLKALFSVLCFLSWCHSALLSPHFLTLNHHLYAYDTQLFSRSILANLTQVSPTSKMQFLLYIRQCFFSLLVSKT